MALLTKQLADKNKEAIELQARNSELLRQSKFRDKQFSEQQKENASTATLTKSATQAAAAVLGSRNRGATSGGSTKRKATTYEPSAEPKRQKKLSKAASTKEADKQTPNPENEEPEKVGGYFVVVVFMDIIRAHRHDSFRYLSFLLCSSV